jgi:hypothetical protein
MSYVLKMPYGGGIISHNTLTNDGLSSDICTRRLRGSPGVIRLVLGTFWSVCTNKFEIWNLYVKNIIFICSLPMLTSTWHSEYCNGPGGYMSGELKSENIKYQKAPTQRSHYPAKDPQSSHHIQPSPRKILVLYTRLFYNTQETLKTYKTIQPRPSSINKTLTDCCSHLKCNYNRWPRMLPEISRRV